MADDRTMMRTTNIGLVQELFQLAGPESEEPNPGEWRRAEPRRFIRVAVEVEFTNRGRTKVLNGHTINVGHDAMCVLIRENIPVIKVRVRKAFADGAEWNRADLIHCTGTFGGYKVGLIMA